MRKSLGFSLFCKSSNCIFVIILFINTGDKLLNHKIKNVIWENVPLIFIKCYSKNPKFWGKIIQLLMRLGYSSMTQKKNAEVSNVKINTDTKRESNIKIGG